MRVTLLSTFLLLSHTIPTLSHPQPISALQPLPRDDILTQRDNGAFASITDLWKRKGGGGGGGKGGGGGSSSGGSSSGGSSSGGSSGGTSSGGTSSGSSGSGSSSSGSSGSGSSSSGSSSSGSSSAGKGLGSSSSSTGGRTTTGSGVTPNYGGGRYYGGGATVPYTAGGRSPLGITPFFLGAGALAFLPGLWLYGAYSYPYSHPYTFRNHSAHANSTSNSTNPNPAKRSEPILITIRQDSSTDGVEQTKPVTCLCAANAECGCDDNGNSTFLDSLIGDGNYANLNQTLVTVADVNGTSTIVLNGTLPNGTTAAGGTEDASGTSFAGRNGVVLKSLGYWVLGALVGGIVWLM